MTYSWSMDPDPVTWDQSLATLGGHPLQSAAWGELRAELLGIPETRILLSHEGRPAWLARIEHRRAPGGLRIGWIPRGPAAIDSEHVRSWPDELDVRARSLGLSLLVAEPQIRATDYELATFRPRQTIWIDLTCGTDSLFDKAHKKWRNAVRRAVKDGLAAWSSSKPEDISRGFEICQQVADSKNFRMRFSEALLQGMIERSNTNVRTELYMAGHNGMIMSAAFVMRCGERLHYMTGGTDRRVAATGAGELLQWHIMKEGVASAATRYDLEGIDDRQNPGTAAFKRRLGGETVRLAAQQHLAFSRLGSVASALLRLSHKLGH